MNAVRRIHRGYLHEAWNGKDKYPSEKVKYYGGYTEAQVKPTPDSPLQKLGIDKAPPIITSAVLLDAKTHLGKGEAMQAGEQIYGKDIESMLQAQGLAWRGLLPGDVLYIYRLERSLVGRFLLSWWSRLIF